MYRNPSLIRLSLAGSLGFVLTACDGKQGSMPATGSGWSAGRTPRPHMLR